MSGAVSGVGSEARASTVTRVLLMDAYCASHVGNDVLLESSLQVVQRAFPNATVVVHAKSPEAFMGTLGIQSGQRLFKDAPRHFLGKVGWMLGELLFMTVQGLNQATLRVAPHRLAWGFKRDALMDFESADVAISIGGEMINDSFRKTLPLYLFMFWLAHRCGSRVMIFPQSIGPLRRSWTRWLSGLTLSRLDLVTARDEVSLDELKSLGLSGRTATFSPDVGVAQPMANDAEVDTLLEQVKLTWTEADEWIGLTTSPWVEEGVSSRDYLTLIAEALREVAAERRIGVLVMPANMPVQGNDSTDYDASRRVLDAIGDICPAGILPPVLVPAAVFKALSSRMSLHVSTRMHASILSTMACTPTITINTQRKLAGFMALAKQSRYSLDIAGLDSTGLARTINEALDGKETIRAELEEARAALTRQLDDYTVLVGEVGQVPPGASSAD